MTVIAEPRTGNDDRIARLLAEGNSLDFVAERGVVGGWTRGDALRVASARGWTLDASGRVPREQRPPPPPGKPLPRAASGLPPGGFQPAPAAPAPTDVRAINAETLIGRGEQHRVGAIRTKAKRAAAAIEALRVALHEQVDADRAHAEQERKREAVRARLAELDAERARLQKLLGRTRKKPSPRLVADGRSGRPINHGTWGGYMAHNKRGEEPCMECVTAKDEHMEGLRGRKATS